MGKRSVASSTRTETLTPCCNQALVIGELVTEPEFRTLPGGSELMSFSLTVRADGEITTSVPLVWFDPPERAKRWQLGDHVLATGPVVRRFYQAGGFTRSRTDVSVRSAELVRNRKRVQRIGSDLTGSLDEVVAGLD